MCDVSFENESDEYVSMERLGMSANTAHGQGWLSRGTTHCLVKMWMMALRGNTGDATEEQMYTAECVYYLVRKLMS